MIFNKLFKKYKFVTMTVIIVILLAALIGVIVHFYVPENNSSIDTGNITGQTEETENTDGTLSGDSTFLVVCADNSNNIVFTFLADFKIYSQSIVITPLTADTASADNRTYGEAYAYGGINLLRTCVEEVRSIDIDRYAVIGKTGFSRLTDIMGEVTLYAQEDFSYETSDKTYGVSKGNIDMGSDMLFTYLSLIADKADGETQVAGLVCTIINEYLKNIDIEDSENLFGEITNCFTTDVTISDYYTAKSDIEYIMSHGVNCILSSDVDSQ